MHARIESGAALRIIPVAVGSDLPSPGGTSSVGARESARRIDAGALVVRGGAGVGFVAVDDYGDYWGRLLMLGRWVGGV